MLSPIGNKNYFEIEEGFSVASIIKSPYAMMIGMPLVLMFLMKKMPSMEEISAADKV